MTKINLLLEAARKIEIEEVSSHLTKLVKSYQTRTKNGKFASLKYNNNSDHSKYIGVYLNEKKWIAYINKEKYRFDTKEKAEKYIENEYIKLKINPITKLRDGYKKI